MGFRFRRSIRLAPGVRINLTKKGVSSVSIGKRGATLNLGKTGVHETVGLPGTGLSYRTGNLAKPQHGTQSAQPTRQPATSGPAPWKIRLVGFILLGIAVWAVGTYAHLGH